MQKASLRKKYKKKRAELPEKLCQEKSLQIANRLLKLPIWDLSFYHLFLSIIKQKEIETEFILHILQGKDKHVVISKTDFSTMEMGHFLLTDQTKLKINSWGIPEPDEGISILTQKIDLVFIPLLAFDLHGNRVGYGKGFYDRFLKQCRPETLKVGLSFFEAEPEIDSISPHDIPLDYCVTPERTYRF